MFSPAGRPMDLAPPPKLKDHRSGSSSSMASSAAGSHYVSERSQSHSQQAPSMGRPSLDDQRPGGSYGRSPLADPAVLPMPNNARRPSGDAMARRPSEDVTRRPSDARTPSPYGTSPNVAGLGMGLPTSRSQPDRLSVGEHLGAGQRRPSAETLNNGLPPRKESFSGSSQSATRGSSGMQRGYSNDKLETSSSRQTPPVDITIPAPKGRYGEVFEEEDSARTPRPPHLVPQTPLAPPKITTTLPSPAQAHDPRLGSPIDANGMPKTRPQRRASFHPPPLTTAFSREVLLTSKTGALPGAAGMTVEDDTEGPDAIMNSVEDMLESFDWTVSNGGIDNGRKKGSADAIESRLLDELSALDSVSYHSWDLRGYNLIL